MAEIISTLEPGAYPTGQNVTVTFPPNTRKAIITRDDRAPVLTEIIAYDTGTIPPGTDVVERPFIAVTQDGKGNVTFDGGFPKFYNMQQAVNVGTSGNPIWEYPIQLPYTSWSQLGAAAEYMNNCIKFCANPRKLAAGNRKILLMGNSTTAGNYPVKSSGRNKTPGSPQPDFGFRDTFEGIAQLGNWNLTIVRLPQVSLIRSNLRSTTPLMLGH